MPHYILCLTLVFAWLTSRSIVHGYRIDQSCRKAGIYDEVEAGLKKAFEMAEAGMRALERSQVRGTNDPPDAPRLENDWDEVPPRPRELQDLIKNLFAHDDIINESQQLPDLPNEPNGPYKQTLRRLKLRKTYQSFKGILKDVRDPGPDPQRLPWSDSIIYCDGSWYERQRGLYVYDKEHDVKRGISGKLCDEVTFTSLAETYATQGNSKGFTTPNTIQLCPPMIREIKRSKEEANSRSALRYGFRKLRSAVKKSAKDILGSSLAVTLLHEMTHTTAGGEHDDVKVSSGGLFGIGTGAAYGWARMTRLAKTLPYAERKDKRACDNNSDSVAYFGLACKLMSYEEDPRGITDDGVVVPMQQPVNWTPNSWKRRWFEATGVPIR